MVILFSFDGHIERITIGENKRKTKKKRDDETIKIVAQVVL